MEQRTVDGDVTDIRVEHSHQVQCLNYIGAILAGQREIGFEVVFAVEVLDLLDDVRRGLGRVTAYLEQGQYQGCELVAHRNAGETQTDVATDSVERK